MQDRYIKDLAIVLGVIALIVLAFRTNSLRRRVARVPKQSIHTQVRLSEDLLAQIQQIEESIEERKAFRFNVSRDPLKQDFVVQSQLDLLAEWEAMVRRMMRLTSIIIDNQGNREAIIAYQGVTSALKEGEVIGGRLITTITEDRVYYTQGGRLGSLRVEPIPPKPAGLQNMRNR